MKDILNTVYFNALIMQMTEMKAQRLERKPHDKVSITPSVSLFLLVCDDPFPAQRDGEQLVTDLSSAFWSH